MRRRGRIVLLLALAVAAPGRADDRDEAKRLKDIAAAAYDRGDFVGALAGFEAAYRLFPSPKLRFNCGVAQVTLGCEADAALSFTEFLDKAEDASVEAVSYARVELQRLQRRLGRVALGVSVNDAVVTVDELRRGTTPLGVMWLSPGRHSIRVAKEGFVVATTSVTLGPGDEQQVRLVLVPEAGHAPPVVVPAQPPTAALIAAPPTARTTTPLYRRWWLWTVAGVALGAAVGSAPPSASSSQSRRSRCAASARPP